MQLIFRCYLWSNYIAVIRWKEINILTNSHVMQSIVIIMDTEVVRWNEFYGTEV